jgi:hypothetical protein
MLPRAVVAKALVFFPGPTVWDHLMDAFFVPLQIINGAKAFFTTTVGLVTFELFLVPRLMLSSPY